MADEDGKQVPLDEQILQRYKENQKIVDSVCEDLDTIQGDMQVALGNIEEALQMAKSAMQDIEGFRGDLRKLYDKLADLEGGA